MPNPYKAPAKLNPFNIPSFKTLLRIAFSPEIAPYIPRPANRPEVKHPFDLSSSRIVSINAINVPKAKINMKAENKKI